MPLMKDDEVVGVLDIDSEQRDMFDEVDRIYLEQIAVLIMEK
mgnify:FL=1